MPTPPEQQTENIKRMQVRLPVKVDGDFGPRTLAAFNAMADRAERAANERRDTIPVSASIEERAAAWCEQEADYWLANHVNPARVAEYFQICEDMLGSTQKGIWLAKETLTGRRLAFCGAAQGLAEREVLRDGETPYPARAGAKQYKSDAQSGVRGKWVPIADVISGKAKPPPRGSLAIYDRPATAEEWDGHIRRVRSSTATGYMGVGANENNRRWAVDVKPTPHTDKDLMGYVYPKGFEPYES